MLPASLPESDVSAAKPGAPPTVLILVDDLEAGGAERQVVELLKGLKRNGRYRAALAVLYPGGRLEQEAASQADLVPPLHYRARYAAAGVTRLIHHARRRGVALIHAAFGPSSALSGLIAARWMRIPVVNGAIRNAVPRLTFGFRVVRWCALKSDMIVANSQAGLGAYGLAGRDRVRVVHNGIDFARFARVAPGAVEWSVCMVGNFNEWKDQATVIRAFSLVRGELPTARFLLVGRDFGGLEASRRLVAEEGLGDAVQFVTDTSDPEPFIAASQVCVLASTRGEGISNVILEYMALGKPVVVTDSGGNAEVVQDQETGFLVPERAPQALAKRVMELLRDPERACRMGAAGHRRVVEVFALDRMVNAYEEIYDYLLQSPA